MSLPGVDYQKLYEVKAITGKGSLAIGPFTETYIKVNMDKVDGLQNLFKMKFREKMFQRDILNAESVLATSGYVSNSEGWIWTFTIWALSASLPEATINKYKKYLYECIAEAEIEFDLDLITEYDNNSETWEEMNNE